MKTEVIKLDTNINVTLTTYLLDESDEMPNAINRPAVLIFPGGGYQFLSDREAEPIAMAFLAEGYHAFILRYSILENAVFPNPLRDAEAALALIRNKADEWHIRPENIAVCGFSAGGHLAAALGTMGSIRPNAMILGYPAILTKLFSQLSPGTIPGLENEVDEQTPPAFIFHTANDGLVPVENALQFASALDDKNIPFELHIFQDGEHGLALAKPVTSSGKPQYILIARRLPGLSYVSPGLKNASRHLFNRKQLIKK